jgi:hypothetical protein
MGRGCVKSPKQPNVVRRHGLGAVDESIAHYLAALETADRQEGELAEAKAGRLKDKIANDRLGHESRPPHLRNARRPEADAPTDRRGWKGDIRPSPTPCPFASARCYQRLPPR